MGKIIIQFALINRLATVQKIDSLVVLKLTPRVFYALSLRVELSVLSDGTQTVTRYLTCLIGLTAVKGSM